jgi:hypothetical protein
VVLQLFVIGHLEGHNPVRTRNYDNLLPAVLYAGPLGSVHIGAVDKRLTEQLILAGRILYTIGREDSSDLRVRNVAIDRIPGIVELYLGIDVGHSFYVYPHHQ